MAASSPSLVEACSTENRWAGYRDLLDRYAARLASQPETSAVVVLGGLAKGGSRMFVDEVSDLDIAVIVSIDPPAELLSLPFPAFAEHVQPYLPRWLPNFKFRVPASETPYGVPIDIDTHQLVIEYESQRHVAWNLAKLEAYAETAEIVHDPDGLGRTLVDAKVSAGRELLRRHLVKTVAMRDVLAEGAVARSLRRGYTIHAQDILGAMLDDTVVAIYAANDRFPPDRKWRIIGLGDLPWQPLDAIARIGEAMLVQAHGQVVVEHRQRIVLGLLDELRDYCERTLDWFPADAYTHAVTGIYPDRQLRGMTSADDLVAPIREQYAKMDEDRWNRANWMLSR
jgi:hypothetical protein